MDNNGLRRLSVREFQVTGPATEKTHEFRSSSLEINIFCMRKTPKSSPHLTLHYCTKCIISFVDVTFIDAISNKGCVQVNDIINAIRPTTCLITVMLANNETGIIQVRTDSDCS